MGAPKSQLSAPSNSHAANLIKGRRYRISSGLGGSFDVQVAQINADGSLTLVVDEPLNPDWNGYRIPCADPATLRELPHRYRVATRVGALSTGPDDYLSWGVFDTHAEAEAAATAASRYPSCHPVVIMDVIG